MWYQHENCVACMHGHGMEISTAYGPVRASDTRSYKAVASPLLFPFSIIHWYVFSFLIFWAYFTMCLGILESVFSFHLPVNTFVCWPFTYKGSREEECCWNAVGTDAIPEWVKQYCSFSCQAGPPSVFSPFKCGSILAFREYNWLTELEANVLS